MGRYQVNELGVLSGDRTFNNRKSDVSSTPIIQKNIDY